jgi:hypothetical protein
MKIKMLKSLGTTLAPQKIRGPPPPSVGTQRRIERRLYA